MELNNLSSANTIQKLPRPDAVPAPAPQPADALPAAQELHKLQGDGLQSSVGQDFDAAGDYDELPELAGNGDAEVHFLNERILERDIAQGEARLNEIDAQMDQIRQAHATSDLYDPDGKHLRAELAPLEAEREQVAAKLEADRAKLAELQGDTGNHKIVDSGFNLPYEPGDGQDLSRGIADPGGLKPGVDILLDAQ